MCVCVRERVYNVYLIEYSCIFNICDSFRTSRHVLPLDSSEICVRVRMYGVYYI